jgi:hypothetical protein
MKIHVLTIAPMGVLLVFFTDGECWQFRVLSLAGVVFGELLLYYTASRCVLQRGASG